MLLFFFLCIRLKVCVVFSVAVAEISVFYSMFSISDQLCIWIMSCLF